MVLDIDDTLDVAHGRQEMAEWNAHYDERCFLPIHIYDTATGRPVAMILRPGKTPSGVEVRRWLRRLIKRIRQHWPVTRITIRGDGHYGRDEAMSWCEDNGVDYIFGFGGNAVLDRLVEGEADDIRTRRARGNSPFSAELGITASASALAFPREFFRDGFGYPSVARAMSRLAST